MRRTMRAERTVRLAVLSALISAVPAAARPAVRPSPSGSTQGSIAFDMVVRPHPGDADSGWVTDGAGVPLYGSPASPAPWPVAWALEHTGPAGAPCPLAHPGCVKHGRNILLGAGLYSFFSFDSQGHQRDVNTMDGTRAKPVTVTGEPGATFLPCPWSGCATMSVVGRVPYHAFRNITWRNVRWIGSDKYGILIGACDELSSGVTYPGWRFIDCEIHGGFDHLANTGISSETGVLAWGLSDFLWSGGSVHGFREEHGFYLHNSRGDVRIERARIYEVGRTAIQIVARRDEGGACSNLPLNPGRIQIVNNWIADTGITPGDGVNAFPGNYHAGSSITITGRNVGPISVVGNLIEIGRDTFTPGLRATILARPDYPPNTPYGAGAIVTWTTFSEDLLPSGPALVAGNLVLYGPDCGDRPAVSLSGLVGLYCRWNLIQMGAKREALVLGTGDLQHPVPYVWGVLENLFLPGTPGCAKFLVWSGCGDFSTGCGSCVQPSFGT
jgi:hypothetical protein